MGFVFVLWDFCLRIFFFALPMYLANAGAMLVSGRGRLDSGKNFFDKRPLLGSGKTLRGTASGIVIGTLAGGAFYFTFPNEISQLMNSNYLWLSFLLALGAIVGDICGSFLKRRFNIRQGKPVLFLDQLDFVFGGFVFALLASNPNVAEVGFLAVVTMFFHRIANWIAFRAKLKRVPW